MSSVTPSRVAILIGAAENENTASRASAIIFRVVYFDWPASLRGAWNRTYVDENRSTTPCREEPVPFRHRAERRVRASRQQAEVGRTWNDRRLGERIDQAVEALPVARLNQVAPPRSLRERRIRPSAPLRPQIDSSVE